MSSKTTIVGLRVETLNLPLTPLLSDLPTPGMAYNLLVMLELADGTIGYGEAAPLTPANGPEAQERTRAALRLAGNLLQGAELTSWRRLAWLLHDQIRMARAARCAVETAMLDALARQHALPLWQFLGGVDAQLATSVTIPISPPESAAAAAHAIAERGISRIKLHAGDGVNQVLERALAVRDAAPQQELLLDGQAAYSADQALELLGALHAHGIRPALFEQPVASDDWHGLRQVATWAGVPVSADESVTSAHDVLRLIHERAAQVVTIKLMKSGIIEALDIAALCRAAELRLMISSRVESPLATSMAACFAGGLGGFHFVDLDAPLLMEHTPFQGGATLEHGRINLLSIDAGHGVRLRA